MVFFFPIIWLVASEEKNVKNEKNQIGGNHLKTKNLSAQWSTGFHEFLKIHEE